MLHGFSTTRVFNKQHSAGYRTFHTIPSSLTTNPNEKTAAFIRSQLSISMDPTLRKSKSPLSVRVHLFRCFELESSVISINIVSNKYIYLNLYKLAQLTYAYGSFAAKPAKPEGPLEVSDIHAEGCTLKWKKPKDDGGEPIEGYLVEKFDPDTGVWLPVGKTTGPEMKVEGLTPGHEYKFRVKALNKEGESEPLETFSSIVAKDPFSK